MATTPMLNLTRSNNVPQQSRKTTSYITPQIWLKYL